MPCIVGNPRCAGTVLRPDGFRCCGMSGPLAPVLEMILNDPRGDGAGCPGLSLQPDHLADLRRSGLSDETIAAAGIRSLALADLPRHLSPRIAGQIQSAYVIPYPGAEDFFRVKLFPPVPDGDGHLIRYYQPAGTLPRLYIPPRARAVLADPSVPLRWGEGEKKCLTGDQEGLACVGLGGLWNWMLDGRPIEDLDRIDHVGRTEILTVDSDVWTRPDLLRPVYGFAKELQSRAATVLIEKLPAGPDGAKQGLDDYLCHHSVAELEALPKLRLTDTAFSKAAEWWKAWRKRKDGEPGAPGQGAEPQGRRLLLADPEPWAEPVEGAQLLEELVQAITRFVVLPPGAAVAIALWIVHAHAIDTSDLSPMLVIISPVKRCGKTTLIGVIAALVPRALLASNITAAAIFRTIDKLHPTLLVDEADTFVGLSDELRGILNAGHTRQTALVVRTVGEDHEPRIFQTFGPKAVALIGRLPDTLMDRGIVVGMRRRARQERAERFRLTQLAELEPVRRRAARWVKDNLADLRSADPEVPTELDDRAADNWRPLFTIADLAGGEWPVRVREAARLLCGFERTQEDSARVQILADLRDLFGQHGTDRLWTETILAEFALLEERPWPECNRGKPITARQLAELLAPFGVRPKQIRQADRTLKGYLRPELEETFARYLPPLDPKQAKQDKDGRDLAGVADPKQPDHVSDGDWPGTARHSDDVSHVSDGGAVGREVWEG